MFRLSNYLFAFLVIFIFLFTFTANCAAEELYLLSRANTKIYVFDSTADKEAPPLRTIDASSTLTANNVYGLTVYGGEIFSK